MHFDADCATLSGEGGEIGAAEHLGCSVRRILDLHREAMSKVQWVIYIAATIAQIVLLIGIIRLHRRGKKQRKP